MKKSILIVEDEKIAAEDIKSKVLDLGFNVSAVVETGEDAIKACKETHPDLVLMDIMLKGKMDGVAASQEIREKCELPVIFLTSHSEDDLLKRAVKARPFGYLMKPVNEKDLRTAIETAFYNHEIETELNRSERKYRLLFERTYEGIMLMESEGSNQGQIIEANTAAAAMHGYSKEEFLKLNVRDLLPPEELGNSAARFNQIVEGEWVSGNIQHKKKDGTLFPIEFHAGRLDLGQKKLALNFNRDISERIKYEAELQKRVKDLENINKMMVDRELKMISLKKELDQLKENK